MPEVLEKFSDSGDSWIYMYSEKAGDNTILRLRRQVRVNLVDGRFLISEWYYHHTQADPVGFGIEDDKEVADKRAYELLKDWAIKSCKGMGLTLEDRTEYAEQTANVPE